MLADERARMHPLPSEAFTAPWRDPHSERRPHHPIRRRALLLPKTWIGQEVWCRVQGEQLVVVGRGSSGLEEIFRHELSTPGNPRILDEHYPEYPPGNGPKIRPLRPKDDASVPSWRSRRRRAMAAGSVRDRGGRIRSKMAKAVELAALVGTTPVDRALGMAALAGRFEDGDLASVVDHLGRRDAVEDLVYADEAYSAQPGTSSWEGFGR